MRATTAAAPAKNTKNVIEEYFPPKRNVCVYFVICAMQMATESIPFSRNVCFNFVLEHLRKMTRTELFWFGGRRAMVVVWFLVEMLGLGVDCIQRAEACDKRIIKS